VNKYNHREENTKSRRIEIITWTSSEEYHGATLKI
jgi:hypothetical protein